MGIGSYRALETLGRVRLSKNFFMREFLHSEIAQWHGVANVPDDPDLAIAAGQRLCEELLEPLQAAFGRVVIRSGFRSAKVNALGNEHGQNCSRNEATYADHIWDHRDAEGRMGATACIVIPWFIDLKEAGTSWTALAWWIHDHLPYSSMYFHPQLCAFNLRWREEPERWVKSYIPPKGTLTRSGMTNWEGCHAAEYVGFPKQLHLSSPTP